MVTTVKQGLGSAASVSQGGSTVAVDGVIYSPGSGAVRASTTILPYGQVGSTSSNPTAPAPNPPQLNLQFDTIGQIIPRSIGHGRLPLKFIWVQGQVGNDVSTTVSGNAVVYLAAPMGPSDTSIEVAAVPDWLSGAVGNTTLSVSYSDGSSPQVNQVTSVVGTTIGLMNAAGISLPTGAALQVYTPSGSSAAPTISFAAALCNPIDPLELGNITEVWDASNQVYSLDDGGLVLPSGWTSIERQQLAAALNSAVVYPGTEGQLPSALIVADRGAGVVPAFRGLRYVIIKEYPLVGNASTLRLSITWRRSNPIRRRPQPPRTKANNITAVQFAAGAS